MSDASWNPWKATALGMALVMSTTLVTGIVVTTWPGPASERPALEALGPAMPAPAPPVPAASARAVPSRSAIEACARYAAQQARPLDTTMDAVRRVAADTRKTDEAYRAAYGSCMRSRGHTT